jgi:TetR/AcrR family transcriptional regulator, mexJK operon transcriptional repressor
MTTSQRRRVDPSSVARDGAVHDGQREGSSSPEADPPRRARRLASGSVIRDAAAALFLEKGYQGTSMDDIAAAAHISKQTIYTHFADKEALFADLVLGNVDRVDAFVAGIACTMDEAKDVESGLRQVARRYLRIVIQPEVLQLRRLVIGESGRFPELARTYYERVPQRVYAAFATLIQDLKDQGRLVPADSALAANHFAWLILGMPMDRGMFYGPDETMTDAKLDRIADAAVRVFMAAYGAP